MDADCHRGLSSIETNGQGAAGARSEPTAEEPSAYNKNAMDLAQDELDAALNVVTSRQEIRKVLEEWESHQLASTLENSRNKIAVGAAEPLPADGGVTLLAIEVASEAQANATKGKAKKKKAPRK
ncbi:unnamed protein product [Aphanomyces euteiches]